MDYLLPLLKNAVSMLIYFLLCFHIVYTGYKEKQRSKVGWGVSVHAGGATYWWKDACRSCQYFKKDGAFIPQGKHHIHKIYTVILVSLVKLL